MEHFDILIIGAGAAGISAAKAAWNASCKSVLLVDRKPTMGGVLHQCTHRGFGQRLNGSEYIQLLRKDFPNGVSYWPNTTVRTVSNRKTAMLSSPDYGERIVAFEQLILATGCREIPAGALPIAGTRPKGIYTAGQMQEMMNLHGFVPEGPVVILGSGDIGLIMAKQLSERNISVTLVEKGNSCGGMARNHHCLTEFMIPLLCHTSISEVVGERYLREVITTDGERLPCKTLLIAVGLRPERELIDALGNPPWLHLCGNCNRIHPMVEGVVNEGIQAGHIACQMIRGDL